MRLQGHFDGRRIVLDQPAPPELIVGTPVEVLIPDEPFVVIDKTERERLLREFVASVKELWERPLPPDFKPQGRQWKREDCYEERCKRRSPRSSG